jgi:hypothetical protein
MKSANEVLAFVSESLKPNSVLVVACVASGVDYGNFIIYLNSENLAFIRLLEHRGFFAKQPHPVSVQRQVEFVDEDGSSFAEPFQATVSKEQALEALQYWLPEQKPTSTLTWEAE